MKMYQNLKLNYYAYFVLLEPDHARVLLSRQLK